MTDLEDDEQERAVDNEGVAFIRRLFDAWDCCGTCAGGVLLARIRNERAAALREAADELDRNDPESSHARWLRARADREENKPAPTEEDEHESA